MTTPTPAELERIANAANETMLWKCRIYSPVYPGSGSGEDVDEYSSPVPESWEESDEIDCGFALSRPSEESSGAQATVVDGLLRLPLSVDGVALAECRVAITKRPDGTVVAAALVDGEIVADELYAIMGEPDVPLGAFLVAKLKRIQGGTVL